jgi:hypothetical protein
MSRTSGIKRFYGLTNPAAQDVNEARKIEQDRINIRAEQSIKFDALVDSYLNKETKEYTDVVEFINEQADPLDRERMKEDLKFSEKIKDLPNKRWWMQLKRMDVQGRAEAYVARMKKAEAIDQRNGNSNMVDQINEEMRRFGEGKRQIGGLVTDEFKKRVRLLESE